MPDPTDGRAALIRATPAADKGFRAARRRLAEIEREWESILGAKRMTQLERTLEKLDELPASTRRQTGGQVSRM